MYWQLPEYDSSYPSSSKKVVKNASDKTLYPIYVQKLSTHAVDFFLLLFSGGGGYLVTSPRLFRAGSTQELSVSLFFKGSWVINSTVRYRSGRGDIIATDGAMFSSDSDGTLKLKVSLIL